MATTMEEIRQLQQQLFEAQQGKSVARLTDSNVVELVQLLLQRELVTLHLSGQGYITPKQLANEIKDQLLLSGGRISLAELHAAINTDIGIIEDRVEKMCEERGILVATSGGKRGNNNTSSPLSHGGGGGVLSSLSPLRFFRSGSASPKKRNTPPASPSSRTSRSNDVFATSPFAKEDDERKKEEEESRSSMTPEVQTRPPLPPKNLPSSSSSPTPFDPSNIIASVVERKKIERLAELREIERVKEGKYGVVTPYENSSPAETPKGGKSSSFEEEYERKEKEVKVALDEVVHSLGKM